jgi:hypothetical protein
MKHTGRMHPMSLYPGLPGRGVTFVVSNDMRVDHHGVDRGTLNLQGAQVAKTTTGTVASRCRPRGPAAARPG